MKWTTDRNTPGLFVTTVATSAWLLSNEEADVVICVIGGVKAAGAEDATVIQRTVPAKHSYN